MSDNTTKTIDPAAKQRIIDKIKKCLALSKSADEHEAAAALRQAQKLMKAYAIDEMEVEGEILVNEFWDTREKFSVKKPHSLTSIVFLMQHAFGIMASWNRSPSHRHRITYWGNRASVTVAIHATKMVYKAVNQGWEEYQTRAINAGFPVPRNAKLSYVTAWCYVVQSKVENLAPNKEKLARIRKAAESKLGQEFEKLESNEPEYDASSVQAGLKAGKDFSLHIPITGGE